MKLRQQIKHLKKRVEKLEAEQLIQVNKIDSYGMETHILESELNKLKSEREVSETPSEKRTWFGLRKSQ